MQQNGPAFVPFLTIYQILSGYFSPVLFLV